MSVYNQPTSNVQSDVPGGPLVSEHLGPGPTIANPLVQGLQYVVNAFAPDHSDEASESFSDSSSSYYSLSATSSSSSLSSEGDALSVDAYLQSDGADTDGIDNPAVQPSDEADIRDDLSDASTEIVVDDEETESLGTATIHPHYHAFDINEPSTSLNNNVASSDSIGPNSSVYVQRTETETFYADSLPDENRTRRRVFSQEYWDNYLNARRAQAARAEEWAKTCARRERIEKRQNEERLAREREDLHRRREAAEREEDRRLEMLVEEAELEMEQKERDKYLLEGEREMRRKEELREAASRKDAKLQNEYLETRKSCLQSTLSCGWRTLYDYRESAAGLISHEEFCARRDLDSVDLGTPLNPGNYHYTRDREATSRSSHYRFHPYSSAVELARSKKCHFHTIGEVDKPHLFSPSYMRYAFKAYQEKWDWLTTPGNEVDLTFRTVPWPKTFPPLTPIEITESTVSCFLLRGAFEGASPSAEEHRYIVEEELKRWYPDSVETWIIPCIVDKAEHAAVREAATAVQRALIMMMASE